MGLSTGLEGWDRVNGHLLEDPGYHVNHLIWLSTELGVVRDLTGTCCNLTGLSIIDLGVGRDLTGTCCRLAIDEIRRAAETALTRRADVIRRSSSLPPPVVIT